MAKKKITIDERVEVWGQRVEEFLNQVDPSREIVRQLRHEELDNGEHIDFYQFKSVLFIVQKYGSGGFQVFVAAPGGRIDAAAAFVKKTEELMLELAEANLL